MREASNWRHVASMLAAIAMVMAGIAGSLGSAFAQDATEEYISPVSGAVIEATSPWELDSGMSASGTTYDIIGLTSASDSLLISYLPADVNIGDAQTIVLDNFASSFDDFEQVDRGSYDDVTYSLDMATRDGAEFGVFSVFLGERASGFVEYYMFMAPAASFADGLAVAQENVTVDGTQVFDGVEGDGLQQMLDDNAGITGGSSEALPSGDADATVEPVEDDASPDPAEDATAEATEEASSSDDRDARRLPADDSADAENESETGRGNAEAVDLADYEELGLLGEGEYVSPQFDTEVLWEETWSFYLDGDEPIVSDTENVTDSVTLVWNGEDFVLLYVDIYEADGFTPADLEELWASDDYLAESADPEGEVLLQDSNRSTGSVLIRDYLSDGEEILLLRQATSLDGGDTLAVVTLIGLPDSFSDAYADAGDGLTVEGDPALDVFTPREIDGAQ
jgi:hypothetical protein